MATQTTTWCFTDHCSDPLAEDLAISPDQVHFLVAQREVCPDTGKLHWQGYVQLTRNQRLAYVQKLLPGAHWEPAKGSPDQNIKYCTKAESRLAGAEPVIYGEPKTKGQRTDLDEFRAEVKSGKRMRTLVDEGFLPLLARYPKLYDKLVALTRPPVNPERKVVLLYGKAGAGKTRYVFDKHGESDELFLQPLSNGTPWFDGYDSHEICLIDDFDGAASKVSLTTTLKLLDIYPLQVPIKGGHAWWNPKTIYVTTNLRPTDWYDFTNRTEQYSALIRRISEAHCWDPETGEFTHCKTPEEVKAYFPYVPKPPPEVRIYK